MESDPEFLGPAGAREGHALRRRPARRARRSSGSRTTTTEHGIWDCTRCYFCNERCPKGVDPRDAIAKLGAEAIKQGIDRDMGAKHAKWFVKSAETTGWLRETELVPKTQGVVIGDQADEVRDGPRAAREGAARRSRRTSPRTSSEARALHDLVKEQGRDGCARDRPGRAGARQDRVRLDDERASDGRVDDPSRAADVRAEDGRVLQGLPRLALGEGARHLDAGARAEGRARADRAGVGHVLRRRRHPRGRAGLLPPPERADPRLRRGDRRPTR